MNSTVHTSGRTANSNLPRKISADSVTSAYRFYAPLYDRLFGAVLEPGRKALAKAVCDLNPPRLLEVGVGTGLVLSQYPSTTEIFGIDLSDDMLKLAKERADQMPERKIRLAAMNAESMDFPNDSFDCVTIPYVLSVTPHPERLISEIRRVCKKGGSILIVNHFSGNPTWWFLERAVRSLADRIGFRSDFNYEDQILKHSWEVCSVQNVNLLGLSKMIAIRNT